MRLRAAAHRTTASDRSSVVLSPPGAGVRRLRCRSRRPSRGRDLELGAQRREVLDDAVVHDGDLAGLVEVRVGVEVVGRTVGGPAGVADAGVGDGQRVAAEHGVEVGQLAGLLGRDDLPVETSAMPAESYPRYSSRRNPPMTTSSAERSPTYPTIPHMGSRIVANGQTGEWRHDARPVPVCRARTRRVGRARGRRSAAPQHRRDRARTRTRRRAGSRGGSPGLPPVDAADQPAHTRSRRPAPGHRQVPRPTPAQAHAVRDRHRRISRRRQVDDCSPDPGAAGEAPGHPTWRW